MGALSRPGSRLVHLPARLLVGRAQGSDLRLQDASVSGSHAVLAWRAAGWQLRDLGSTNGTLINGRRVEAGAQRQVSRGDVLTFGLLPEPFRLVDDAAPGVFARRLLDGAEATASSGILALPSTDSPLVQILPIDKGRWICHRPDGEHGVTSGQVIEVCDERWEVLLPTGEEETYSDSAPRVRLTALCFRVSSDEETVIIEADSAGVQMRLESRSHNYVLLQLARQRILDRDLPRSARGWIDRRELAKSLRLDPEHLNVQLFRLRKAFTDAGLADCGNLVETRKRPSQIRIGIEDLKVCPL